MTVRTESKCAYTVFDSLEYICDKCNNSSLTVRSMNDLDRLEEIFDCDIEKDLVCWECSPNKKPKPEIKYVNNTIKEL